LTIILNNPVYSLGTSLYSLHRDVHFKEGHKLFLPLLKAKVQFNKCVVKGVQ